MRILGTLAAAIALVVGLCTIPAPVFAAPAHTTTLNFDTALSDWNFGGGSAFPYAGELKLQLRPDGTISGWYTNADTISFIPVIGAKDSKDNVWLDIGDTGALHVNGQLQNGKIVGTATEGGRLFDFTATPQA